MMKLRLANLEYLIDINDLHDELGYVRVGVDEVRIGAMTRHRELLESAELAALFPIFADAEAVIADPVVRNRGTIGGSLCQADPSEDLSAVCTTLERDLRHPRRRRRAQRRRWRSSTAGPTRPPSSTARCSPRSGIPVRPNGSSAYAKVERRAGRLGGHVGRRRGVDGRRRSISDARVGLAAVGPNTTGIPAISEALRGQEPVRRALRAGRARSRPRAARRSPTTAAAPSTSGTSPTS